MLEQLTVENFQAHHHLSIDLDPTVTTIVGPSDAGKSAVIRALIWLATNRPLGATFIRDGTKQTRVALLVDGHEIIRTRGKSVNTYSIDGEELKAFGNDVPSEIADLLNLSSINLQGQHDSPFWFSNTAGEVSRQLNQIVDLSIIDRTLGNLDKASRSTAAEVRTLEQQEARAKEERATLSWARKAQGDIEGVEEQEIRWKRATKTHQALVERAQTVRLHQDAAAQLKSTQEAAERAFNIGSRWDGIRSRAIVLKRTIITAETSHQEIRRSTTAEGVLRVGIKWEGIQDQVSRLHRLTRGIRGLITKSRRPVPDLIDLVQLSEEAVNAAKRTKQLRSLLSTVRNIEQEKRKVGEELKRAGDQFHEQMGEECPLCGQKL